MGNLGALLLSAGRLPEALLTLDESIQLGLQFGHMAQGNTAGILWQMKIKTVMSTKILTAYPCAKLEGR